MTDRNSMGIVQQSQTVTQGQAPVSFVSAGPLVFTHRPTCPYLTAAGGTGQCTCSPEWDRIRALESALADSERAKNALLAFWHEVREHDGQCTENDFWDWSMNLGLMRVEPYDPEKHGPNDCDMDPGDDWHLCTDITKRRPAP